MTTGSRSESTVLAVAATLETHAAEVRGLARQVAAVTGVEWHSRAAEVFREHAQSTASALVRCAALLEHAAAVVRAHAHTTEQRAELLEHAEQGIGGLARALTGLLP